MGRARSIAAVEPSVATMTLSIGSRRTWFADVSASGQVRSCVGGAGAGPKAAAGPGAIVRRDAGDEPKAAAVVGHDRHRFGAGRAVAQRRDLGEIRAGDYVL